MVWSVLRRNEGIWAWPLEQWPLRDQKCQLFLAPMTWRPSFICVFIFSEDETDSFLSDSYTVTKAPWILGLVVVSSHRSLSDWHHSCTLFLGLLITLPSYRHKLLQPHQTPGKGQHNLQKGHCLLRIFFPLTILRTWVVIKRHSLWKWSSRRLSVPLTWFGKYFFDKNF